MTNLANIKRLYLWKPSICKTFWTTLVYEFLNVPCIVLSLYLKVHRTWR